MSTLSMPPPTYPSTLAPAPVACRPLSIQSLSSHRAYAPRRSSPLAEGPSTTSRTSSLFLASPTATPPDSPRSLSFTNVSTSSLDPSMLRPKPTHSKSLPTRVRPLRRPATAPFTPTSALHRRRTQSTSSEHSPRQSSAPEEPPVQFRPVKPSTSRAPEENWMTSESAPRFTRESLALGAVVLPVRKDDAQRLGRPLSISSAHSAHAKYATMPNTAIGASPTGSTPSLPVSTVTQSALSTKTVTVPSVRIVDADGASESVDSVSLDLSKRDGTWKKHTASLKRVRRLSMPKMKIRSGQVKPTLTVTQEKGSDPGLTEKPAVEKDKVESEFKVESDLHPRPSDVPSKRTKSIWAYIIGFTRMTSSQ